MRFKKLKELQTLRTRFLDQVLRTETATAYINCARDTYFSKAQRYMIGMSPTPDGSATSGGERAKGEGPPKTALVRVFSRDPIRGGLTNRGNLVTLRADVAGALFIRFCFHFLEITRPKSRCLQKAVIQNIRIPLESRERRRLNFIIFTIFYNIYKTMYELELNTL